MKDADNDFGPDRDGEPDANAKRAAQWRRRVRRRTTEFRLRAWTPATDGIGR